MKKLKNEVVIEKQNCVSVTVERMRIIIRKMPNWKAPGPDLVQEYWLKNFRSLHDRIAVQLDRCLSEGSTPSWMTKGRIVLIMMDSRKGSIASNYRSITCLPIMWKLLTGIVAEEMYNFPEEKDILPEEQKGCRKGTRGTNDLLYIDKMITKRG